MSFWECFLVFGGTIFLTVALVVICNALVDQ
jgi:hypothetical protein